MRYTLTFSWDSFWRTPNTPKPANQKTWFLGTPKNLKNREWCQKSRYLVPRVLPSAQMFSTEASYSIASSSKTICFGARTFRTPTSKSKFSILTKILNFDPKKIWVVGFGAHPNFFLKNLSSGTLNHHSINILLATFKHFIFYGASFEKLKSSKTHKSDFAFDPLGLHFQ